MQKSESKMQAIRDFMKHASGTSAKAHEVLLADLNNQRNELVAAIHLNKAISLVTSAKAIYYSDPGLEKSEVEDVFVAFDEFSEEFLDCLYPIDSHQWTVSNYDEYKKVSNSFFGS